VNESNENKMSQRQCRRHGCKKLATNGYSCCSSACRAQVPNCNVRGCMNATEQCITHGIPDGYTAKCYQHGGRVTFDGDQVDVGQDGKLVVIGHQTHGAMIHQKVRMCRRHGCSKPAQDGGACCSKVCRDQVPTCRSPGCSNATERDSSELYGYTSHCRNCMKNGCK